MSSSSLLLMWINMLEGLHRRDILMTAIVICSLLCAPELLAQPLDGNAAIA
jgi:hypothetical protein